MTFPFIYVATDIAPGVTLRAWRHERRPADRPFSSRRRLARLLTLRLARVLRRVAQALRLVADQVDPPQLPPPVVYATAATASTTGVTVTYPPHPSEIPRLPMTRTATVRRIAGARIWRYRVDRLHGIGILENSMSLHCTRKRAEKAAARWRAKP